MKNQERTTKWRWLQFALLLGAAAGGYAAAMLVLAAPPAGIDVVRMAACIRELAAYESSLPSERLRQRGEVEYFYNREHDLCLYRTNYVCECV